MLLPQDNMIICNLNIEKLLVHYIQRTLKHIISTQLHQRNIHLYRLSMLNYLSNLHMVTHKHYNYLIPSNSHQHTENNLNFQIENILCRAIGKIHKSYLNCCNNFQEHKLSKPGWIRKCHKEMCIKSRNYYSRSIQICKINNEWLKFHKWHKGYRMQSKHFLI